MDDDYYPFGLTMAGISSKSAGKLDNKYKFNGGTELANKEFSDGRGLELYETDFRSYDPQIGRFHQVDFLSSLSYDQSPYAFVNNNPITFIDPLGLDTLRGSVPEGYKPNAGDILISENGPNQIYDADRGWAPQVQMDEVVVTPGNNKQADGSGSNTTSPPTRGNDRAPATNIPAGINFGDNANRMVVSQYSINMLSDIMRASGNPNVTITSTMRTPEDQARAMYNNIISRGAAYNLQLYSANGDRVVNVAAAGRRQGLSKDEILRAMAQEMRRIGPGRVSRHAGDPSVINVLDISPHSIRNRQAFVREIRERGIFLLQPPSDPAFHLEIRQ
jgi:RHS repeat-associated protein